MLSTYSVDPWDVERWNRVRLHNVTDGVATLCNQNLVLCIQLYDFLGVMYPILGFSRVVGNVV